MHGHRPLHRKGAFSTLFQITNNPPISITRERGVALLIGLKYESLNHFAIKTNQFSTDLGLFESFTKLNQYCLCSREAGRMTDAFIEAVLLNGAWVQHPLSLYLSRIATAELHEQRAMTVACRHARNSACEIQTSTPLPQLSGHSPTQPTGAGVQNAF